MVHLKLGDLCAGPRDCVGIWASGGTDPRRRLELTFDAHSFFSCRFHMVQGRAEEGGRVRRLSHLSFWRIRLRWNLGEMVGLL